MKTHLLVLSLLVIPATQVRGQPAGALAPRAERFFKAHCIRCHGAEKQEGEFRIDTLSSRVGFEDTPQWVEIMERINSGEMPPEDVPNPPDAELKTSIVEWIAGRMKEGEAAQMAKRDRVSYRRLTREKYVCTMRDLIGVQYDATDPGGLLEDPECHGSAPMASKLSRYTCSLV